VWYGQQRVFYTAYLPGACKFSKIVSLHINT
jgi:hypothetical protein